MSVGSSDCQSLPSPSPQRWTATSLPQSSSHCSYSGDAAGPLLDLAVGKLAAGGSRRPSGFNPNAAPFHPLVRSETDDGVEGSRMSGWSSDGMSGSPTCSLSPPRWRSPYRSSTATHLLQSSSRYSYSSGATGPLQDLTLGRRSAGSSLLASCFKPYAPPFQPLPSIPSFAVPVANPLPPTPPSSATSSRPSVRPTAKFQDVGGSDARLSHSSSRPPRPIPTLPTLAGHDSPLELNYPELDYVAPRFVLPVKLPALEEDVLIMDGELVSLDSNNAGSSHRAKSRPATRNPSQRSSFQSTSRGTGAFMPRRPYSRSRTSDATTTTTTSAPAAGENDNVGAEPKAGMAAKTMVAVPPDPSSTRSTESSFRWPTTAEEDTQIMQVLYGPSKNQRLPVFKAMFPV